MMTQNKATRTAAAVKAQTEVEKCGFKDLTFCGLLGKFKKSMTKPKDPSAKAKVVRGRGVDEGAVAGRAKLAEDSFGSSVSELSEKGPEGVWAEQHREVARLTQELGHQQSQITNLGMAMASERAKSDHLRKELATMTSEDAAKTAAIAQLQAKLRATGAEASRMAALLADKDGALSRLQARLQASGSDHVSMLKYYGDQVTQKDELVREQQRRLEVLEREKRQMEQKVAETARKHESEAAAAQAKVKSLEHQMLRLRKEATALEKLAAQVPVLKNKADMMQRLYDAEKKASAAKGGMHRQQVADLDSQLSIFQEEATTRCEQQAQLNSQLTRLQSAVSHLEAERKLRQGQIDELFDDKAQLEQQVEDLEGEASRMQGQIVAMQARKEQLKTRKEELKAGRAKLKTHVSELQAQLQKIENEKESLCGDLKNAEAEKAAVTQQVAQLESDLVKAASEATTEQAAWREVLAVALSQEAHLKKQKQALEDGLAVKKREVLELRLRGKALTEQVAAKERESKAMLADKDAELEGLEAACAQNETKAAELRAAKAAVQEQLQKAQDEIKRAEGVLIQKVEDIHRFTLIELQNKNNRLSDALRAAERQVKQLATANTDLQKKLDRAATSPGAA